MLMSAAGTLVFIGPELPEAFFMGGLPVDICAGPWGNIGEVEAIGLVGSSWQVEGYAPDDPSVEETFTIKVRRAGSPLQLVMGFDPEDEGQADLWRASESCGDFCFRILFPDGSERFFAGVVTAIGEALDTANSVIKLQAEIQPNTRIHRKKEVQHGNH